MKKLLIGILVVVMLFCFVGCGENGIDQQNTYQQNPYQQNDATENISSDAKEEIILTTDNIGEYLTISCSIEDVTVEDLWNQNYSGKGNMTIKTSPRQRGDFEGVTITVAIKPVSSSSGWLEATRELIIPFDGKFEETFSKNSGVADYVSSSPSFKIVVTSVTGKFIK